MSTTHTRSVIAVVGAAIVSVAAQAILFLGAGTAQAMQDISERGAVAIVDNLPTPRDCGLCRGFNPQPDPPGNPDPDSEAGVGNPNEAGVGNPNEAGAADPDDSGVADARTAP